MRAAFSFILAMFFFSAPSYGDCRSRAIEAFESIHNSGPFRFRATHQGFNGQVNIQQGSVIPYIMGHDFVISETNNLKQEQRGVGKKSWVKDRLGWRLLSRYYSPFPITKPLVPAKYKYVCFGLVKKYNQHVVGFSRTDKFNNNENWKALKKPLVEKLFIDPNSRLPTLFQSNIVVMGGIWSEIVFSHDPKIVIKAPTLKPSDRKKESWRLFRLSQKQTTLRCRNALKKVFYLAKNTGLYYQIGSGYGEIKLGYQKKVISAKVWESKPFLYNQHHGQTWSIRVDNEAWEKSSPQMKWVSTNRIHSSNNDVYNFDHIGRIRCETPVGDNKNFPSVIEFEKYRVGFNGVIELKDHISIVVDPVFKTPMVTNYLTPNKQIYFTVTRRQENSISVLLPRSRSE